MLAYVDLLISPFTLVESKSTVIHCHILLISTNIRYKRIKNEEREHIIPLPEENCGIAAMKTSHQLVDWL